MPSANADLPMLGRPATMIRLPGWRPDVIWSTSRKPVGVPVISPPDSYIFVICSKLSRTSTLDVLEAAADAVLGEVEHHLLGPVDELGRLARPVPAEPLDLLADDREPAQRRHLADDPRVVAARSRSPGTSVAISWIRSLPPTSSSSPFSSSLSATVIASTGWPCW